MKKYKVWLTLDEIEKVKKIIPNLDFQIQMPKTSRRTAYQWEYAIKNRDKIKEYSKRYAEKKRKEKKLCKDQ